MMRIFVALVILPLMALAAACDFNPEERQARLDAVTAVIVNFQEAGYDFVNLTDEEEATLEAACLSASILSAGLGYDLRGDIEATCEVIRQLDANDPGEPT